MDLRKVDMLLNMQEVFQSKTLIGTQLKTMNENVQNNEKCLGM